MASAQFEVLPLQAEVIENDARHAAIYGGVGSGKTMAAQWKMFQRLRKYPKARHFVAGPTFELLRNAYFPEFVALLEDVLGWRSKIDFDYRASPQPKIFVLREPRATLESLSAELGLQTRSLQFQTLHAEEPQTWVNGERFWQELGTRMRHNMRSARHHPKMPIQDWLTFNPRESPIGSWLYRLVEEDYRPNGHPVWKFRLVDNYLLIGLEHFIEDIKLKIPPNLWSVEIEGEWPTTGGGVYRSFDQRIHTKAPDGLPVIMLRDAPLLWSLDFNVGLQCSVIAQSYVQPAVASSPKGIAVGWQRRMLFVIDEIALPDAGVEDVLDTFMVRYGAHAKKYGLTVFGDASGGARSQVLSAQSAIRSNWMAIRKRLTDAGIPLTWSVPSVNPSVGDRVNAVNAQLRTGEGYGLLVDQGRCPVLINDFLAVQYKPGTNDIEKKTKPPGAARLTHMSDAFGYLAIVERHTEPVFGFAFGKTTR